MSSSRKQSKAQSSPVNSDQRLSPFQSQRASEPPALSQGRFEFSKRLAKLRGDIVYQDRIIEDYKARLANFSANQLDLHETLQSSSSEHKSIISSLNWEINALKKGNAMVEQELAVVKMEQWKQLEDQGMVYLFGLFLWRIFSGVGLGIWGIFKWFGEEGVKFEAEQNAKKELIEYLGEMNG